ncbi:hypothetical protein ACHAQA_002046 [Verticillium albo-atrum]
MTSLPSQHPSLSLHLSDRNLHPILTSARSDTQLEALTSLATTSLTAHAAAHRLALGHPQRLMVEHGPGAPVVLTSYLDPAAALSLSAAPAAPSSATSPHRAASPSAPGAAAAANSASLTPAAAAAADPSPSTLAHSALAPPTDLLAATTLSGPDATTAAAAAATSSSSSSRPNGAPAPRSRPHTRDSSRAITTANAAAAAAPAGKRKPAQRRAQEDPETSPVDAAPMLVGVVVASTAEEAFEARRAAVRLERVAREVQREWTAEENRRYDSDESG